MYQLRQMIDGGTEALLNHLWMSQIRSFDDISPHLRFAAAEPEVAQRLSSALDRHQTGFEQLVERFLQGNGIPSLPHFEEARPHFSGVVDLGEIEEAAFRPRIFCWALTGSPTIDVGAPGIRVCSFLLFSLLIIAKILTIDFSLWRGR